MQHPPNFVIETSCLWDSANAPEECLSLELPLPVTALIHSLMCTALGFPQKTDSHNLFFFMWNLRICVTWVTFFCGREDLNLFLPVFGKQCCGNMGANGANIQSIRLYGMFPPSIINSFVSCSKKTINVSWVFKNLEIL